MYAPVAVQYEVIRNAAESGLKYVNMGASVNLAGVSDFKDSWGASEHKTYTFNKQARLFKIAKKIVTNLKKIDHNMLFKILYANLKICSRISDYIKSNETVSNNYHWKTS